MSRLEGEKKALLVRDGSTEGIDDYEIKTYSDNIVLTSTTQKETGENGKSKPNSELTKNEKYTSLNDFLAKAEAAYDLGTDSNGNNGNDLPKAIRLNGENASSAPDYSIAIGEGSKANSQYSFSMGKNNNIKSGEISFSFGQENIIGDNNNEYPIFKGETTFTYGSYGSNLLFNTDSSILDLFSHYGPYYLLISQEQEEIYTKIISTTYFDVIENGYQTLAYVVYASENFSGKTICEIRRRDTAVDSNNNLVFGNNNNVKGQYNKVIGDNNELKQTKSACVVGEHIRVLDDDIECSPTEEVWISSPSEYPLTFGYGYAEIKGITDDHFTLTLLVPDSHGRDYGVNMLFPFFDHVYRKTGNPPSSAVNFYGNCTIEYGIKGEEQIYQLATPIKIISVYPFSTASEFKITSLRDNFDAISELGLNVVIKSITLFSRDLYPYDIEKCFNLQVTGGISKNQTILGQYNVPNSDDIFQIGCGTSDNNRKNAFSIDKDGIVKIGEENYLTSSGLVTANLSTDVDQLSEITTLKLTKGMWIISANVTFNSGETSGDRNLALAITTDADYWGIRQTNKHFYSLLSTTTIKCFNKDTTVYLKGASSIAPITGEPGWQARGTIIAARIG